MSRKVETEKQKRIQEKCTTILTQLLHDDDNKYCVDCDAKGPRWASWNIGVFLCIRCAGIHRNLGVHISRVKSVNLDTWTPEQVVSLQQMGNSRGRAVYEAMVPDGFRRPQNDQALESFIRAKYEQKKYIAKEWIPDPLPKIEWEKEIEEELERQRKKKKAITSSSAVGQLAPLPAPTNDRKSATISKTTATAIPPPISKAASSPKNNISVALSKPPPPPTSNSDLLGLSSPDSNPVAMSTADALSDSFGNFLSKSPTATNGITTTTTPAKDDKFLSLDKEEADFFNQTPAEKERAAKMTKDSILALYGTAPATNFPGYNAIPGAATSSGPYVAAPSYIPAPAATAATIQFASTANILQPPAYTMPAGVMPQWPATVAPPGAMQIPTAAPAFGGIQAQPQPADSIAKQFGGMNLWQ